MKANKFKECKHYVGIECLGIKSNMCMKHKDENCRGFANPQIGCDDYEREEE